MTARPGPQNIISYGQDEIMKDKMVGSGQINKMSIPLQFMAFADAFRRLQSLQDAMEDIQKSTDNIFKNIIQDVRQFMEDQKIEIETKIDTGLKEIKSYVEESRRMLSQEITDFLNKQTALVGNLTQQIDSCQRAINVLKADLDNNAQTTKAIGKDIDILKGETGNNKENINKLSSDFLELKNSNDFLRDEINKLKGKFTNTEFVKKFAVGWVLVRKE